MASTDKPTRTTRFLLLLGPCASILCFIHCVGFALVTILAPTLFHNSMHDYPYLEHIIWLIVIPSSIFSLKKHKAGKVFWIILVLLTVIGLSQLSTHSHQHNSLHFLADFSLLGIACLQIIILVNHHRKSPKKADCCK